MTKTAITFLTLIAVAGSAYAESVTMPPFQSNVLGTENGRYVFGQLPDGEKYMLDVRKGRLWILDRDPTTKRYKLSIVPYENIKGKRAVGPKDIDDLSRAIVDN